MSCQCHNLLLFANIPDGRHRCPTCGNVMKNAARSKVCGCTFGLKCILEHTMKSDACPVCKAPLDITDVEPAQTLRDEIENLDSFCEICLWRGPFSEMEVHQCGLKKNEETVAPEKPATTSGSNKETEEKQMPSPVKSPLFETSTTTVLEDTTAENFIDPSSTAAKFTNAVPTPVESPSETPMKTLDGSSFIVSNHQTDADDEDMEEENIPAVERQEGKKKVTTTKNKPCFFHMFDCSGNACTTETHLLLLARKVIQLENRCSQLEAEREMYDLSMAHGKASTTAAGVTPQRSTMTQHAKFKTPVSSIKKSAQKKPRVPLRPKSNNTAGEAGGAKGRRTYQNQNLQRAQSTL